MGTVSIFHWLVMAIAIAIFAVPIWFAVDSARRKPDAGFAGWLFLLAIAQVLFLVQTFAATLQFLPLPGNYDMSIPNAVPAYVIEGALNVGLLAVVLTATIMMFRRRRSFRQWFTAQWIAALLVVILDVLLVALWFGMSFAQTMSEFGEDLRNAGGSALMGAIAIAYVWRSKRVANTFTN